MLRSTFVTAVSISIILLGLYILFSALLSQRGSFEQSYHIGCYLDNQVNDHYFQIKQAIEQLAIKEDQRLSKLSMYRSAVLADNSFDRKAYEVARKF